MEKILVPIDGSDRSQKSLDFIKQNFSNNDIEVTLINVGGDKNMNNTLETLKNKLTNYNVNTYLTFGHPGEKIIEKSIDGDFDTIIMTKSTRKNFIDAIGSVTLYVVKKAKSTVIILPE